MVPASARRDHAFTILGRQMGWFIVAGWFGFGSLFMYTSFKVFQLRLSTRAIWLAFFGACLGATVFEEILQNMGGMYVYYAQPAADRAVEAAVVVDARATRPVSSSRRPSPTDCATQLRGWRGLAMFAITPAAMGAAYGFIALPSWIVVNGDYSWWVTQLGGLASIALGLVAVALIIRLVLDRDPFDLSGPLRGTAASAAPPRVEAMAG